MKIIVDTSVWSLLLRRKAPPGHAKKELLEQLIDSDQPLYIMGIIVQELLQYLKEENQFQKISEALRPFPLLEPDYDTYVLAAELSRRCRKKGIQAGTIDSLIAATAIEQECSLLTADVDFEHIASVTNLRLI